MALASSKKSLSVNVKPLRPSMSIIVASSVPDKQVYSATKRVYTPDYAITPLVLMPRCSAIDASSLKKQDIINEQLTNIKWYERIAGVRKQIQTGKEYTITLNGREAGKLRMHKNSTITAPVTLEFTAEYTDPRNGQVLYYYMSRVITVKDETEPKEVLKIDSSTVVRWNPVRDQNLQKITATIFVGDEDKTNDINAKFFWYRQLDSGALEQIVDGNGDNDWEVVSVNRNVLEIDRDFIGDGQSYICKGYVDKSTHREHSSPNSTDSSVVTTIQRIIPKLGCGFEGATHGLPEGTRYIYPKGFVYDNQGIIENPEKWFKFIWMVKTPKGYGFSKVAEGINPRIKFSEGLLLRLEIEDLGPQALLVDDKDTSSFMSDEEGSVIYQRLNQ